MGPIKIEFKNQQTTGRDKTNEEELKSGGTYVFEDDVELLEELAQHNSYIRGLLKNIKTV